MWLCLWHQLRSCDIVTCHAGQMRGQITGAGVIREIVYWHHSHQPCTAPTPTDTYTPHRRHLVGLSIFSLSPNWGYLMRIILCLKMCKNWQKKVKKYDWCAVFVKKLWLPEVSPFSFARYYPSGYLRLWPGVVWGISGLISGWTLLLNVVYLICSSLPFTICSPHTQLMVTLHIVNRG